MIGKLVTGPFREHRVQAIISFQELSLRLDLLHLQREAVSVGLDLEIGESAFLVRVFRELLTVIAGGT